MGQAYKYYRGFISQEGTSNPTVRDIDNTVGRIIWERTGVGTYTAKKTDAFRKYKTLPYKDSYTDVDGNYMTIEWTDSSTITLKTYAAADTSVLADDVLTDQFVNIEVYV